MWMKAIGVTTFSAASELWAAKNIQKKGRRPWNGKNEGNCGRKPFYAMNKEELLKRYDELVARTGLKTRTELNARSNSLHAALKEKGLLDELHPIKKTRERRALGKMSDGEMIDYYNKNYKGKISSWDDMQKIDSSFYLNFVTIRALNREADL